jgi:hypothetical protein
LILLATIAAAHPNGKAAAASEVLHHRLRAARAIRVDAALFAAETAINSRHPPPKGGCGRRAGAGSIIGRRQHFGSQGDEIMGPGRKIASGLLLGAGLLLAAFAGGPAVAQDEDFCRAYAYQALDAAKGHYDSQCGGDENGRYSLDVGFHYSTCMGWGGEAMKWAARETNIRSQAFYNC